MAKGRDKNTTPSTNSAMKAITSCPNTSATERPAVSSSSSSTSCLSFDAGSWLFDDNSPSFPSTLPPPFWVSATDRGDTAVPPTTFVATVALVVVVVVDELLAVVVVVFLLVVAPIVGSLTLMSSSPVSSRESLDKGPFTSAEGGSVAVGDKRGEAWLAFSFWCRPGARLGGCSAWEVPRVCNVGASSLGGSTTTAFLLFPASLALLLLLLDCFCPFREDDEEDPGLA